MKSLVMVLAGALLFSCTQKQPAVLSATDETPLILATLENETRAFYRKDHVAWSQWYVHSPRVQWVCVEPDVTLRAKGWEDLSQFVQQWMKANPEPMNYEKAQFRNENVQVTVQDSLAFVSFTGTNLQPDGSTRSSVGTRVLQKQNGRWKILSMTSYPADSPKGSTGNVYVHAPARQ